MSQYQYTPSVATPSRTPQPGHKGKKKKRTPKAQIHFARKIILKEFPRCFPWIKEDKEVTIEDITDLFEKFKIYVCDVEFKKEASSESKKTLCAFVYTRRTRGSILEKNIWELNVAIGWNRRKGLAPVARVLSNYRRDFAGKKPSNGLHITSFDLFKDTQKRMEALFGKFVKGKKDGKKVSVILNIDRFGDPYALVFFKKECFAKEAWKVANSFEEGLSIGNQLLTVRYSKKQ